MDGVDTPETVVTTRAPAVLINQHGFISTLHDGIVCTQYWHTNCNVRSD